MTHEEIKDKIVAYVTERQGMKHMEVFAMPDLPDVVRDMASGDLAGILEELVQEKRLVEVEYALPEQGYRIKSFLLPAGSHVWIRAL